MRCEKKIFNTAKSLGKQSIIEAGRKEYQLAVEARDVNEGIPLISYSGWIDQTITYCLKSVVQ